MKTIKTIPKFGDISWDVIAVQQQLFGNENSGQEVTGIFDRYTEGRIILFQQQNNIESNFPGTLGPITLEKLGIQVSAFNPILQKKTVTSDFLGKKDRHLHPNLRVALEIHLFPGGKILDCFKQKNIQQCKIAASLALSKIEIKESNRNNFGTRVGEVQGTVGTFTKGGNGDDWCLDYEQITIAILEDYFKVESPYPATASTINCWNLAVKVPGLTTTEFEIGSTCIAQRSPTRGHAMSVISEYSWDHMNTAEGNVEGKAGLFVRNKWINGDLKTLGYIRAFPFNSL